MLTTCTMLQSDLEAGTEWRFRLHDNWPKSYPAADHDAHARSVAADAYWNQVRRTVDGEPVNEAQITLIVNAIAAGLSLRQDDIVLDLACGNGALSSYLFDKCAGLVGVDMSPYMIEVAQKNFARSPKIIIFIATISFRTFCTRAILCPLPKPWCTAHFNIFLKRTPLCF